MLAGSANWFTEGFDTADLRDAKELLEELSIHDDSSPSGMVLSARSGCEGAAPISEKQRELRGRHSSAELLVEFELSLFPPVGFILIPSPESGSSLRAGGSQTATAPADTDTPKWLISLEFGHGIQTANSVASKPLLA